MEGLPEKPGVYLFKDSKGEIIYIGKAKDLRKRVRSYLHGQKDLKTSVMLSKVAEVDHMVTETEKEALILEDALVKEHKPRYNIKLRDDKNYPLLRLSVQDRYPRLTLVRRVKADGALYFGPFPSAQSVRETMRLIHWVFPLRRCSDSQFTHRSRPCLNFQMRRCLATCCRRVPEERYRAIVDQVRQFLEGEGEKVLKGLEEQMRKEAEALNFEEAARLRDRITALRKVLERQRVVSLDLADRDVIAMLRHRGKVGVYVLSIRGGKLLGGRFFDFKDVGLPDQEVLSSFLSRYYSRGRYVPPEVVVPFELEDASLIEDHFLMQGVSYSLHDSPVHLAFQQHGIQHPAAVMGGHVIQNFHLAGFRIDLHLDAVNGEGVGLRDIALGGFGVHHFGVGFVKSVGDDHFPLFVAPVMGPAENDVDGNPVIFIIGMILQEDVPAPEVQVGRVMKQR